MKKIAVLLMVLFPALSRAQIEIVKKPVLIIDVKGGAQMAKIERDIVRGDTFYYFTFRDNKYSELIEIKYIVFRINELREFSKALKTAEQVSPGDHVDVDSKGYFIAKGKGFGSPAYMVFYKSGYCNLSSSQAKKLTDAIDHL